MNEKFEEFILNFFRKLKCEIADNQIGYVITKIPKSFLDLIGKAEPLKISFTNQPEYELINSDSQITKAIEKYLDNAGKTTLLKIDFETNPEDEIKNFLNLNKCEIDNIEKKHKNNYFARFSFLSIFNYLNEREQTLNEIYVYNGKVVNGDLSGYKVIEGINTEAQTTNIKEFYEIAKEKLKSLLDNKTSEIGDFLSKELATETQRITDYYNIRLSELGGDLTKQIQKINELEVEMRTTESEKEKIELKSKIEKLRKGLIKIGDDDAKNRILKEKEFSVQNAKQKFSLNITNKLINTTIIYYPIYTFKLLLTSEEGTRRLVDVSFDPLTKEFNGLKCESCQKAIRDIQLCSSGHITCQKCIDRCGDCNKILCKKCLVKKCSVCAKTLCKDCFKICQKCGKYVCSNCLRNDCVTGEEICLNCLRACSKCHGLTQEKNFKISRNGSKICQKCIAEENRNTIIKKIFE